MQLLSSYLAPIPTIKQLSSSSFHLHVYPSHTEEFPGLK